MSLAEVEILKGLSKMLRRIETYPQLPETLSSTPFVCDIGEDRKLCIRRGEEKTGLRLELGDLADLSWIADQSLSHGKLIVVSDPFRSVRPKPAPVDTWV